MEKFEIILTLKRRVENEIYYVEYSPNNDEYDDQVKKCDTVPLNQIEDLIYLEQVTVELFNLLEDKFGTEFTDKYML
jgi:hypothetical protein